MKIVKWLLIILLALGSIGFIAYSILNEELPAGEKGEKAEQLADKMLTAVNDSAWQKIAIVKWSLRNNNKLVWDKNRHWAKVSWDDYEVYIRLDDRTGVAFAKDKKIEREELLNSLLEEAYGRWANDSFWLNPITKIREAGTIRKYVPQKNEAQEGLLVTFTTGGVTPGDSYLWIVDKKTKLPEFVKMWVQIIPVGGVQFSWENWHQTPGGAKIATEHQSFIDVSISNLDTWLSLKDYPNKNEFKVLE